jgi:RecJ-like exonuclease
MIKGITGSGSHIRVVNAGGGTYYNTGNMSAGMVRYYNNELQVYDGLTWLPIQGSYSDVSLTHSANSAIDWAMKKMQEEQELEQLASEHPAIQAAYKNMKKAAEQLKATIILSKEHDTTS